MAEDARLQMQDVHKRFGATWALRGVNLSVQPGEVHALVGENGAGKSTLMKVLSGAVLPDRGQIWLDGQPFVPGSPLHARQSGIAMIYQELSLAPHLSVMENILLGIEPHWGPWVLWKKMRQQAAAALAQLEIADIPLDKPVRELSVAQQQLVEIARAMAMDCRVLILDEPTSSLTQQEVPKLFALIRRLRDSGHSIIYISHFLEEVQQISDRFTVLRDGQTVGTGQTCQTSIDQIVAMMVGRQIRELYPRSHRQPGEVLLDIQGLSGPGKPQDVSLQLRRGEVLGIAGLVGAGRTELLRTIFGLAPVRAGKIRIGLWSGPAGPPQRWRQAVGYLSEDRKQEGLALSLSLADNITLPRLERLGVGFFVWPVRQAAAALPWIQKIPIQCQSPWQPVSTLSGGNQQKVALARLLHADVDVLLLDEPTRGIDVGSKAQIYQLIDELVTGNPGQGRRPKSVLMVSSSLPELLGLCDRIGVMCRGRLVEVRPAGEWTEHELMLAATGPADPHSTSVPSS
ncbi:MAG: sugar ABC transporter ATP-binding protein [Thermoguttaceae bacterium]|nr:sugar ABC transporter ATP-binding protein [Thermoguttaceae bacterium]MDW8037192.1 sugar ABC transporter ATP-binding protein [Thermoguttaceae bacterium]